MKHILVDEDDPSIFEWICDYLTKLGYEVSVVGRGDFAVDLIAEDKPDLVLLDAICKSWNASHYRLCQNDLLYASSYGNFWRSNKDNTFRR